MTHTTSRRRLLVNAAYGLGGIALTSALPPSP